MSKVRQIKVAITVTKSNGEDVEHCSITHVPGQSTLIEYANGHSPELESYTINILENALRDAKAGAAGGAGVQRFDVPAASKTNAKH